MMRFDRHLYSNNALAKLLLPLSWLFALTVALRRALYRAGIFAVRRVDVPVIVVGNITVGGVGKTPLVIALVQRLRAAGYKPGVVSRGYGGNAHVWPQPVRVDSDTRVVGDEAVLIVRHTGCPMAVAPDRVAAANALLKHADCDVIIADDGLQHYALARDVEIAVIDGVRRYGNGCFLPAGPLREPRSRLQEVDFVVAQGIAGQGEWGMKLVFDGVHNMADERCVEITEFRGQTVHAVAGIGHPRRFFDQLKGAGVNIIEHEFPDHHAFRTADFSFADGRPILMTEKDAVKCRAYADQNFWYIRAQAQIDDAFSAQVVERLKQRRAEVRNG